jgi:phage shock protein E
VQSQEFTAVIDVRTAEEFNAGHVPGAVNLDIYDPAFSTRFASLDPEGAYLVYCRSGNRSAQAVALMREAGLTATDGGGLSDMQEAGWEFVR